MNKPMRMHANEPHLTHSRVVEQRIKRWSSYDYIPFHSINFNKKIYSMFVFCIFVFSHLAMGFGFMAFCLCRRLIASFEKKSNYKVHIAVGIPHSLTHYFNANE